MENNKIWKFETLDDAVGVINARKKIESALIYNPNELIAPELLQIDELDEIVNFYPDTFEVEYQQERFVDINELVKRFFEQK